MASELETTIRRWMLATIYIGITCALVVVSSNLAAGQTSPHALENRRWRVAKYRASGNKEGDEPGLIDAAKTAEITFAKGRIHGSPTCGELVGTYRVSGDQLTVTADFILNGFCPPEQLKQNQQVLNVFKGDLRVEEKDDHIVLRDKSGQVRLLLVPY
jgi:heat shock protein HslJ